MLLRSGKTQVATSTLAAPRKNRALNHHPAGSRRQPESLDPAETIDPEFLPRSPGNDARHGRHHAYRKPGLSGPDPERWFLKPFLPTGDRPQGRSCNGRESIRPPLPTVKSRTLGKPTTGGNGSFGQEGSGGRNSSCPTNRYPSWKSGHGIGCRRLRPDIDFSVASAERYESLAASTHPTDSHLGDDRMHRRRSPGLGHEHHRCSVASDGRAGESGIGSEQTARVAGVRRDVERGQCGGACENTCQSRGHGDPRGMLRAGEGRCRCRSRDDETHGRHLPSFCLRDRLRRSGARTF